MNFPHEPTTKDALRIWRLFMGYLHEPRFRFLVGSTAILVFLAALVMRILDHKEYHSFGKAAWWAVQTVTTVGYGDVTPATPIGRSVAAVLMLVAIAFLAILTSIIASSFVVADPETRRRQTEVTDALQRIEERLDRIEAAASTSGRKA